MNPLVAKFGELQSIKELERRAFPRGGPGPHPPVLHCRGGRGWRRELSSKLSRPCTYQPQSVVKIIGIRRSYFRTRVLGRFLAPGGRCTTVGNDPPGPERGPPFRQHNRPTFRHKARALRNLMEFRAFEFRASGSSGTPRSPKHLHAGRVLCKNMLFEDSLQGCSTQLVRFR